MNYYYSYPYGGPVPNPSDPYWRYQQANPMGGSYSNVNPNTVEPPFPAGAPITPQTPTEPGQGMTGPSVSGVTFGGFEVPVGNVISMAQGNSYVSNILRLNRGTFVGIIQSAGKDHIVLSDPNTGHRFILLTVYLDYVEFPEEINYYYPLDNTLNMVDPDLFEKFPALGALYNYQKQQDELFKQKYPYYNQLPENFTQKQIQQSNNYMAQPSYGNSEQF